MADFTDPADPNATTWARFARHLESAGRSPRTIQSYREAAQQLADHAKGRDLMELSREDVQLYLIEVRALHSPSTEQVRFRSLRAYYNWAVREEWCDRSPMHGMPVPKAGDKPPDTPDTADLRKLLATCSGKDFRSLRDAAILRLMADCGLRLAECAGLAVTDLDQLTDHVTVKGKGSRWRKVRYSDETAKALARYLRARSKHARSHLEVLWLGSEKGRGRGAPLLGNGIAQMLRKRCRQAGTGRLHPHQLRHWSASEHLLAGLSGEDAMERFGWHTPAMLRVYARDTAARRANEHAAALAIGNQL